MKTVKTFSLTSENLKKFEKELQEKDKKRKSLQRNIIPERTEADGRSSGIHSYGSQLSAFKETLNSNHVDTKKLLNSNHNSQSPRKHSYSLDRPEREAFRRNPEGQSRNESSHATPHIVKMDYEEGSDRIKYNSDSEKGEKGLVSSKEEEEESDDDDDDSSDDDDDSSDDDDDDDESDEESDETDDESDDDDEETETTPKRPLVTPTTVRTHYTSSINASVSSIPTVASVKNRPESTNTIKTTKTARKRSAFSNASSTPSYILNMNQYRMKKMAIKKEKEFEKLGAKLTESELSYRPSRRSNASAVSLREKSTTSAQSNGSYVATRNWSRWSNYSAAGYSISEGPEMSHMFRKPAKKGSTFQNKRIKTSRPQSRCQMTHFPVIGKKISSKSVPDLRKTGKRHVTLTLDPGLLRARAASRSQIASRLSTRSIIKRPTTTRVKSVPDLNKQAVMSYFETEREVHKSASRPGLRKKSVKAAKTLDHREAIKQNETDIDNEIDFTNRRKRLRKLKERPQKQRNETSLSSASSAHSNSRRRNKAMNKRGSSLSSALSMSSLKSSQTMQSGKPASSSASSKASLTSRKARLLPLKKHAGYHSGRDHMSSGTSLQAPGTPFSVILQRSPSLRSVVTEYSSYLSLAASSVKSARPTSRSSLLSTGKY